MPRSSLVVGASPSGVTANEATSPSRNPSRNLNPAIADHAAVAETDPAPRPALAGTATVPSPSPAVVDHAAVAVTDPAPHPALAETATAPSPSPAVVDHAAVAVTAPAPHPALAEAATGPSPSPVADHAAVAATDPAPHPATDPHIIRAAALAADSR